MTRDISSGIRPCNANVSVSAFTAVGSCSNTQAVRPTGSTCGPEAKPIAKRQSSRGWREDVHCLSDMQVCSGCALTQVTLQMMMQGMMQPSGTASRHEALTQSPRSLWSSKNRVTNSSSLPGAAIHSAISCAYGRQPTVKCHDCHMMANPREHWPGESPAVLGSAAVFACSPAARSRGSAARQQGWTRGSDHIQSSPCPW